MSTGNQRLAHYPSRFQIEAGHEQAPPLVDGAMRFDFLSGNASHAPEAATTNQEVLVVAASAACRARSMTPRFLPDYPDYFVKEHCYVFTASMVLLPCSGVILSKTILGGGNARRPSSFSSAGIHPWTGFGSCIKSTYASSWSVPAILTPPTTTWSRPFWRP